MIDFNFVVDAYGFLLPFNKPTTCMEWAEMIADYYDISVPQNKEACLRLQGMSDMFVNRFHNGTIRLYVEN